MYRGHGITFDGTGSCSFNNEYPRNVTNFGVYNSSSSHADNRSYISNEEFVSVNVLREYNEMKEEIKNPKIPQNTL